MLNPSLYILNSLYPYIDTPLDLNSLFILNVEGTFPIHMPLHWVC